MKNRGFTLVELLAVIVILGIILAIAVPSISDIIQSTSVSSFESDAKMVLKQVEYQKLKDESFDATKVNKDTIASLLGLSNENYSNLNISVENNIQTISIIGKGKWDGYVACGNYLNMRVVRSTSECSSDLIWPVITILGDNPTNIFVGDTYSDAGATAVDDKDGNITSRITTTGNVNPNMPGLYSITYRVADLAGNEITARRNVNVIDNSSPIVTFNPTGNATYAKNRSTTVNVTDISGIDESSLKYTWSLNGTEPNAVLFTNSFVNAETINTPPMLTGSYYLWITAADASGNKITIRSNAFNLDNEKPVITITGNTSVTINKDSVYTDAGATVTDNIGADLTPTVSSNVNPSVVGTYIVTYNAIDEAGNIADSVTRTVQVVDVSAPVITMLGSNPTNINVNSVYSDAGTTALDDVDGDVTNKIVVSGAVNPTVVGIYTVTYTVSDVAGNTATATRTVNVIDNVLPTIVFGTNGNATYTKTRSTTVTVSDNVAVNTSSLKYQWTTSATAPTEGTFSTPFTNGGTLSTPAGVTGGYYLWILAKDNVGNASIVRTNVFNLDNIAPVITMNGTDTTVNIGSTYNDAGATVADNISTGLIPTVSSDVNTNVVGTYTVTYNANDNAGNVAAPVVRTVNVIDNVLPTIAFGTNGNSTYAKTRSTTVTVSDNVAVNASSLKYQWTTSATAPTEGTFNTTFTNGGTISTPAGVTGGYYLWILAKDNVGNMSIVRTNVFNLDNTIPVITMNGTDATINIGSTYNDAGATVADNISTGLTPAVTSNVNPNVVGTYTVTYNAIDGAGNAATTVVRTVNVIDTTAPIITILGSNPTNINIGSAYTDAGATASDNVDGNITGRIVTTGSVNVNAIGTYTITYTVKDNANNQTVATRTVNVIDSTAPVITVLGSNPVVINVGSTYTDAGATATDNVDGNITGRIVTTGTVNPSVQGTYTITYTVKDNANNQTVATRTVNVVQTIYTYSYNGSYYTFNVAVTGTYKLEVWGAQGGSCSQVGGLGGYATGNKALTSGTAVYVYVGGQGTNGCGSSGSAGYNGAGSGGGGSDLPGGGGGGATDMRTGGTALANRIIVAGGGGGAASYSTSVGGAGGGTSGLSGGATSYYCVSQPGGGGTGSSGGAGGSNSTSCGDSGSGIAGSLGTGGKGGTGYDIGRYGSGGGGGGGYYGGGGGGGGGNGGAAGGGGSGYIGGVTSGQTFAGNQTFTSPGGGNETGHSGSGYAKITYIGP